LSNAVASKLVFLTSDLFSSAWSVHRSEWWNVCQWWSNACYLGV